MSALAGAPQAKRPMPRINGRRFFATHASGGSGVNPAPWLVVVVMLLIPSAAQAQRTPGPPATSPSLSEMAQRVLTEGVTPRDNEMAQIFELPRDSVFKEKALLLGDAIHRIHVSQTGRDIILACMIHYGTPQYEISLYLTSWDGSLRRAFHYGRVTGELQELPLSHAMEGFEKERAFWLKWRGGTSISP